MDCALSGLAEAKSVKTKPPIKEIMVTACPRVAGAIWLPPHFSAKMLLRPLGAIPMRILALLFCLTLAACSSASEGMPQDVVPPPDPSIALRGLKAAASDAHLAEPVEVSDPIRAPPNSTPPWLICLRSGQSQESRRLTYSAFFKNGYVSSRWSSFADRCAEQVYHPLKLS